MYRIGGIGRRETEGVPCDPPLLPSLNDLLKIYYFHCDKNHQVHQWKCSHHVQSYIHPIYKHSDPKTQSAHKTQACRFWCKEIKDESALEVQRRQGIALSQKNQEYRMGLGTQGVSAQISNESVQAPATFHEVSGTRYDPKSRPSFHAVSNASTNAGLSCNTALQVFALSLPEHHHHLQTVQEAELIIVPWNSGSLYVEETKKHAHTW